MPISIIISRLYWSVYIGQYIGQSTLVSTLVSLVSLQFGQSTVGCGIFGVVGGQALYHKNIKIRRKRMVESPLPLIQTIEIVGK
jgi:hypothetical protein